MKTKKSLLMLIAIAISISSCLILSSCSKDENDSPVTPPIEVAKPIVQTMSAKLNGNYDSVLVSGKIISDGNSKITACGIKYSCEGDCKKIEISPKDSGTFTVKVPIKFGVSYTFNAYGTNSVGTSYGSTLYYSYSADLPVISETSISEITETSGVAMDTLVDNGKLPTRVTILYGKTAAYTDSIVIDTINRMTFFKFLLRNLEAGSEYHFCFKAENLLGTVYTSDRLFCTGIKDIDGNLYPVVKIGDQLWIAKNLMVTHYNDGSPIANPTADADWLAAGSAKSGAYCWYSNNQSIGKTYGALYNWYTIATGKLAPKGWHVPTYDEFIKMIVASYKIGGPVDSSLKETGFNHWKSPNSGATNATGFSAIPSGERAENKKYEFGFLDLHLTASWWTADEWVDGYTRILYIDYDKPYCFNDQCPKNMYGIGVRIIKDSK